MISEMSRSRQPHWRIGNAFIYANNILQCRCDPDQPWTDYANTDCQEAAMAAYRCVKRDPDRFRIYRPYPSGPGRVVEV